MKLKSTLNQKISKVLLLFTLFTFSIQQNYSQNNGKGKYLTGQRLQHASGNREYSIYIPVNYNSAKAVPMVLLFHGFTNNIAKMYSDAQMEAIADANNFIFVIPQGLGALAGWNIGLSFGGNADDIGFIRSLIDKISTQYTINANRIYASGFSNGGFFSYRLACELSDKIAAIASVAGSMNPNWISGSSATCKPKHPTPIMQITGTNDNVIPIAGGNGGSPLKNVFNYWIDFNNTSTTPVNTNINSVTKRSVYGNGDKGSVVEFIEIGGRGHEWPTTSSAGLRENASIRIWEFFSKYDKNGLINTLSNDTFSTSKFVVYPNPTNDNTIFVNYSEFTEKRPFSIVSLTGQIVSEGNISSSNNKIDLTNLNPSVYFLNIDDTIVKIIKTN